MPNMTIFDPKRAYILFPIIVTTITGEPFKFDALLDSGAPRTEFSDETLQQLGFLDEIKQNIELKYGLQTHKYGKIVLPYLEVCSHPIDNLEVYVSHFDKSWGIKALIGLDFFRKFRTTIDYQKGQVITEPYGD